MMLPADMKQFVKETFDFIACAQCSRITKQVYLFPTPNCDHRLCKDCSISPPTKCPICKTSYNPVFLTPDRCFLSLWDHFVEIFDERTFKRLISQVENKALARKHGAQSRYKTHKNQRADKASRDPLEEEYVSSESKETPTAKVDDEKVSLDLTDLENHEMTDAEKRAPILENTPQETPKQLKIRKTEQDIKPKSRSLIKRKINENGTPNLSLNGSKLATPKYARVEPIDQAESTSTPRTPSLTKSYLKRNKKGETVLHELCTMGFTKRKWFSIDKLREMIDDGANPNTTDGSGITPLHESIIFAHLGIMVTLLRGGALVNGYNDPPNPRTPLHVAVEKFVNCQPDDLTPESVPYQIITTLLDYGADICLKDCFKRTPCDIAASNPNLSQLLKDYHPRLTEPVNSTVVDPPTVVLYTGLNKTALDDMKKFEAHFKIKCYSEQRGFKLQDQVTHLVVPNASSRANHFIRMGILSGCYVIKFKWVSDCLEQGRLLPSEDYEIQDPLIPNSKEQYVTRKARLDRLKMRPKLFVGGKFFVMTRDIDAKMRAKITEIIQAGGGQVLTREPRPSDHRGDEPKLFHAKEGSMWENCSILILYACEPRGALYRMDHIKHAPVTWFYDCVDTYSIREE